MLVHVCALRIWGLVLSPALVQCTSPSEGDETSVSGTTTQAGAEVAEDAESPPTKCPASSDLESLALVSFTGAGKDKVLAMAGVAAAVASKITTSTGLAIFDLDCLLKVRPRALLAPVTRKHRVDWDDARMQDEIRQFVDDFSIAMLEDLSANKHILQRYSDVVWRLWTAALARYQASSVADCGSQELEGLLLALLRTGIVVGSANSLVSGLMVAINASQSKSSLHSYYSYLRLRQIDTHVTLLLNYVNAPQDDKERIRKVFSALLDAQQQSDAVSKDEDVHCQLHSELKIEETIMPMTDRSCTWYWKTPRGVRRTIAAPLMGWFALHEARYAGESIRAIPDADTHCLENTLKAKVARQSICNSTANVNAWRANCENEAFELCNSAQLRLIFKEALGEIHEIWKTQMVLPGKRDTADAASDSPSGSTTAPSEAVPSTACGDAEAN